MLLRVMLIPCVCGALAACSAGPPPLNRANTGAAPSAPEPPRTGRAAPSTDPLVIGESFTLNSTVLSEPRRINVFAPTDYGQKFNTPLPVLYVLDGGMDEDFLHIAGLVQILVSDHSMRPFLVVGIQNTSRRRDMTGPTMNPQDRKIAPVVGGSAPFRRFIREELMPAVASRYRTTNETAVVGESLAGLFVFETFFREPALFRSFIAIDPSLWWADRELITNAAVRLTELGRDPKTVFVVSSSEPGIAKDSAAMA